MSDETRVISIHDVHVPVLRCTKCDKQVTLEPTQLRRGETFRGECEGWYAQGWRTCMPGWLNVEVSPPDGGFKRYSFCPDCRPAVEHKIEEMVRR